MRALRHLREDAVDLLHLRRTADHGAQSFAEPQTFTQLAGCGVGRVILRGAIEHCRELVHGKGFGQVIRCTAAHGFDGRIH